MPVGTLCVAQAAPFHRSTAAWRLPFTELSPTAVHALSDEHDTATNVVRSASAGAGAASTVQRIPSHRSASGAAPEPDETASPTAVQTAAEEHETPFSSVRIAACGAGVASSFHAVPFHRSTTAWTPPEASVDDPTAVHALADEHDTAASDVTTAPDTVGAL
jgi:hypothetical protein